MPRHPKRRGAPVRAKPAAAPPTVRELVLTLERRFESARLYFGHGTDNARDEAAWLVASVLAIPFDALDAAAGQRVPARALARIERIAAERVRSRKPLAYLLREAWFAGLRFYVDERVIVPRSLVGELLPGRFAPWVQPARVRRILDLCTGSGCIAIALARAFPGAQVDAVDISPAALAVAARNVAMHRLKRRVHLIPSDLLQGLGGRVYDLIVTNPPYVDARDMAALPAEYRHEPELALASGPTGLDAVETILREGAAHLSAHGVLVGEVGNSARALARRHAKLGLRWLRTPSGDESIFLVTKPQLKAYFDARRRNRS